MAIVDKRITSLLPIKLKDFFPVMTKAVVIKCWNSECIGLSYMHVMWLARLVVDVFLDTSKVISSNFISSMHARREYEYLLRRRRRRNSYSS